MKRYKVAIVASMPKNAYLGARYYAWALAEAISTAGDDIILYTDNIPVFSNDFSCYPGHGRIRVVCLSDFQELENISSLYDYVICLPPFIYCDYYSCLIFSLNSSARFILINCETPNWFEKYGRKNSNPDMYRKMQDISAYGSLVLSFAKVSLHYAEEFFCAEKTVHDVWAPAINSMVADSAYADKENQIFIAMRLNDKHKGGDILLELLDESLRGITVACMFGRSYTDNEYFSMIKNKAEKCGIRIKPLYKISDKEKFTEVKKSKVLLYPSTFEGYGYPPVEALYCGTYVLASDLPVIREVCGDAADYCAPGDVSGMRQKTLEIMGRPSPGQIIVDTGDFFVQSRRIHEIFEKYYGSRLLNPSFSERLELAEKVRKQKEMEKARYPYEMGTYSVLIANALKEGKKLSSLLDEDGEHLERIPLEGKSVYLYGCGGAYSQLYPKYSKLLDIHGIIDGDEFLSGTFDSVSKKFTIQTPDILRKENAENTVVFITPANYIDDIIRKIRTISQCEVHSLCMIEMNAMRDAYMMLEDDETNK